MFLPLTILILTVAHNMRKSLTEIKFGIFISIILTSISSCSLIPCGWDSDLNLIEKKPQTEFLVGKYKLDERTLKYIQGYENAISAELNIKSDGTFEMRNVPKGTLDFMGYYYSMDTNVNATGNWKTNYRKGTAELNVSVKFDSTKTDLTDFGTSWRIYEKDDKPIVFIMVGDPDECSAARFEKKSE